MPANKVMPGEEQRSEKFHEEQPPKEQGPAGYVEEHGRGEGRSNQVGQFTGAGRTPGVQKK